MRPSLHEAALWTARPLSVCRLQCAYY